MATIGTFTRTSDGYVGLIDTLTFKVEASLVPAHREHEKSPDYRITRASGEFGAAWKRVSAAERDYLSCKFDDPAFPGPVYASMYLADDGESYVLVWTR